MQDMIAGSSAALCHKIQPQIQTPYASAYRNKTKQPKQQFNICCTITKTLVAPTQLVNQIIIGTHDNLLLVELEFTLVMSSDISKKINATFLETKLPSITILYFNVGIPCSHENLKSESGL